MRSQVTLRSRRGVAGASLATVIGLVASSAWIGTAAQAVTYPDKQHFLPSELDTRSNAPIDTMVATTAAQSFGYDTDANVLYTVQVSDSAAGDLQISKLNNDTLERYNSVTLKGFGHGISIGVQGNIDSKATPKNAYIWVETAGVVGSDGDTWGTRIAQIVYQGGTRYEYDKVAHEVVQYESATSNTVLRRFPAFSLAQSGETHTNVSVNFDWTSNRLVARMKVNGGAYQYRVYGVNDVLDNDGTLTNLAAAGLKAPAIPESQAVTQGFALFGHWIYWLTGTGGEQNVADANTRITAFRIDNAGQPLSQLTPLTESGEASKAGGTNPEPEGMAIRAFPNGTVVLRWGLVIKFGSVKKLAIYQKKVLVAD